MERSELPKGLNEAIGAEELDFAVKAGIYQPPRNMLIIIIVAITIIAFFLSILSTLSQGENTPVSTEYLTVIYSLFGLALTGLGIIASGIFSSRSGYYAGTRDRLIHYRRNRIRSVDWEQLSNIEVKGSSGRGTIVFRLRTGKIVSGRGAGNSRFVQDVIYVSGIPGVHEIAGKCRKRIRENKPAGQ